jgi:hypothetical protein
MLYFPRSLQILFFLIILLGCRNPSKKSILEKDVKILSVPSASACEQIGNLIFIVGDDSPYLYRFDLSFRNVDSMLIYPAKYSRVNRIDKEKKHDYESMTSVQWNGQEALFILGSGSKKARQKGLIYLLNDNKTVQLNLRRFYSVLSAQMKIDQSELNCEGMALHNDQFILANKPTNSIISISWKQFVSFVSKKLPSFDVRVYKLNLPSRNQHIIQLTGLDFSSDGTLYFTAYSNNGAKPGQIYPKPRAIIGKVNLSNLENVNKPNYTELNPSLALKIEGISMLKNTQGNNDFILVSDGENEISNLFHCQFAK